MLKPFIHPLPFSADLLTLHRQNPERYPFLLESQSVSSLSRFSILFAFAGEEIRSSADDRYGFLAQLDTRLQASKSATPDHDLPFRGGWFVYLGYELARQIEPVLNLPQEQMQLPVAIATRVPAAIIQDHLQNRFWFIDETGNGRLDQVLADVHDSLLLQDSEQPGVSLREDPDQHYLDAVERISEYIRAGDVFQVNLSRAWHGKTDTVDASRFYERLRRTNPAPFAALANYSDFAIISSSPERLIRVQDRIVDTRPIAGTRPRSDDPAADEAYLKELISHPKERAEHIMLIDLERNDLGRICQPGTVEVDELMAVESYEHVHHIVSNVRGRLRDEVTPGQVLAAVFPGGTITGCPKVRCMEIIAELEQTGRGPYTGSLGYINHNGDMDFNILIRTMVKKGQQLSFRTGAGIVYDSIPKNELLETRHKAKGLLKVFDNDPG